MDNRPKFDSADVIVLREYYADMRANMGTGETIADIDRAVAEEFGVSRQTVANVTSGKTYKKLGGPRCPRPGQGRTTLPEPDDKDVSTTVTIQDELGNVLHNETYTGRVNLTVDIELVDSTDNDT